MRKNNYILDKGSDFMYQYYSHYNYSDLDWEIDYFKKQGFKFLMKGLFYVDPDTNGHHIIYCEFKAVTEEEAKKHKPEWHEWSRISYQSRIINAKWILRFVKECILYKNITYMKLKDKLSEDEIKRRVQYRIESILKLTETEDEEEELEEDIFYRLYEDDGKKSSLRDISLENLNHTAKCSYFDFDPTDYSQSKDSSTGYYQLDFTSNPTNLDSIEELVDFTEKYYPSIFDLIFDKFGKDLDYKNANLRNKLLFILPKDHIGKVELELVERNLIIKTVNMKSDDLLLKIQIKRDEPKAIKNFDIKLTKKKKEQIIELDFIPDTINGFLLDEYTDNIGYRVQKIVKKYDNIISDFIDEKTLRKIIREGEGLKTDFKLKYPEVDKDKKDKDIIRKICAFANAEGGLIIFGVNDDAEIKGYDVKQQFDSTGDFDQYIVRLCNEKVEQPVEVKTQPLEIEEGTILIVKVFKNTKSWVRIKGSNIYLIRKGSTVRVPYPDEVEKCRKDGYSSEF